MEKYDLYNGWWAVPQKDGGMLIRNTSIGEKIMLDKDSVERLRRIFSKWYKLDT